MLTKKQPTLFNALKKEQADLAQPKTTKTPKASLSKTAAPTASLKTPSENLSSRPTKSPTLPAATPNASTLASLPKKKGPISRITVKYDVGFANALFLRGKGAGLSWDKGIALKNVKTDEWVWETDQSFTSVEFKVLINDKEYEIGDNHSLTCGASIQYAPQFPPR